MSAIPREMWTEFDPVATRPTSSALLWFVGRDARGSPVMSTDALRVVDLTTVTVDQAEAYRALHAINGSHGFKVAA